MKHPRDELRALIRGSRTMDYADWARRNAVISQSAYDRFHRLWAWGTATEHPLTRAVPLPRWSARRERIRQAVRKVLAA